jgi:hypothetical protein
MVNEEGKKVSFLPFHAINGFMTNEYRLEVVRSVLNSTASLPPELGDPLERAIKKTVKIAGFRNSAKAPTALKVKPFAEAFEKSPALVAATLAAWADAHRDLRQRIYDLLAERSWELLPIDTDRTRLPGFIAVWPKGEDFEVLAAAFDERYKDFPAGSNDIALMCVWLSTRLPYQFSDGVENSPAT